MSLQVKICGLRTPDTITAALEAGADFIGLVFHPDSPRHVEIEVAAYLASYIPDSVRIVGLFANPDDQTIAKTLENVRLDLIQLHGHESPARVSEIRQLYLKPVIKALPVEDKADLEIIHLYTSADWIMLDARANGQFGGHGQSFDWSILRDYKVGKPWMLAGGLTPENVAEAIATAKPDVVDVSSGVETARGIKDSDKIRSFIAAAKSGVR